MNMRETDIDKAHIDPLREAWGKRTATEVVREALARCALDAECGELGYLKTLKERAKAKNAAAFAGRTQRGVPSR